MGKSFAEGRSTELPLGRHCFDPIIHVGVRNCGAFKLEEQAQNKSYSPPDTSGRLLPPIASSERNFSWICSIPYMLLSPGFKILHYILLEDAPLQCLATREE